MATSAHVYGLFLTAMAEKVVNLNADTIKVMLVTSAYTPNQATDQYASTPQAHEATGTGYAAGGVALSSVVITNASNVFKLSAANPLWTTLTTTARYGVVYDTSGGSLGADVLIGYIDFGADQSPAGITFEIDWAAGVVFQNTAS